MSLSYLKFVISFSLVALFISCNSDDVLSNQNNVSDITKRDINNDAFRYIDGDITFYWQQFPFDSLGNFNVDILKNANTFNKGNYLWTQFNYPAKGFGTFRFTIKNVNKHQALGLKIANTKSASEIWVNGEQEYGIGKIGSSKLDMIANGNLILIELPKEPNLEIVIPVSNFHHRIGGGFPYGIIVDNYEVLKNERDLWLIIESLLISIILLIGLFNLYLYFSTKRGKIFLYFGLFAICIIGRQLFVGENIIYIISPDINFWIVQKGRYLMFYLSLIFGLHYYSQLFPLDLNRMIVNIITAIVVAACVFVIFAPIYLSTYAAIPMIVIATLIILLGLVLVILGLVRKRSFAKIIFISSCIALTFLLNDILHSRSIINSFYLMNVGFMSYILLQTYINHKLNLESKREYLALNDSLKSMEIQVSNKTKEVTQLMSETIQHLKSKEKIVEKLKSLPAEDNNIIIKKIVLDLQSEKIDNTKALLLKQNIEKLNLEFIQLLKVKHPFLTKTDIEICMLIKHGLSNKEIANLRHTTQDAVKKSRQRLRIKLNIEESIDDYLKTLND